MNDEFYIGYLDGKPPGFRKAVRWALMMLAVLALVVPAWLILHQGKGEKTEYQFGKLTEFTGNISLDPVPLLHTDEESIMLVGFPKFGAESAVAALEAGDRVKLKGTLIKGHGKMLLELTDGEDAVLTREPSRAIVAEKKGELTLSGKIIDPKCYFGAMNPGAGKTHRACAIRCISGGIPPVLEVRTESGMEFFILTGRQGEKINQDVLEWVDIPIEVSGKFEKTGDWNVLKIDVGEIQRLHISP